MTDTTPDAIATRHDKPRAPRTQTTDRQLDLLDYGRHEAETRAIAAASSLPKGPSRRERVIAYVTSCGTYGATPDEISIHLDIPAHSVPSLVGPLRNTGRLVATSKRRNTRCGKPAVVYVARSFDSRVTATNEGSV